jgi:hypothetical protein
MAPSKKGASKKKARKRVLRKRNEPVCAEPEAAKKKFIRDVQIRGEAARLDNKGKLPLEATHEIVKGKRGEAPTIQRRRFKLY